MRPLTDIKGIGDSKAKELNELGINTIADLAAYEGDEVTTELVEKAKALIEAKEKEAAKSAAPEVFEFDFLLGQHGGRKFTWRQGDQLYTLGDGTMPDISGVTLKEVEDDNVKGQKFLFIRNNGKSSAVIHEDIYKRLKIAIAKKKASLGSPATQTTQRVATGAKKTIGQRVAQKFGCKSCGR